MADLTRTESCFEQNSLRGTGPMSTTTASTLSQRQRQDDVLLDGGGPGTLLNEDNSAQTSPNRTSYQRPSKRSHHSPRRENPVHSKENALPYRPTLASIPKPPF